MARMKAPQPAPGSASEALAIETQGAGNEPSATNETPVLKLVDVVESKGTRANTNLFTAKDVEVSRKAAEKVALMGTVRQRLAEANDLFAAGEDKAKEATSIADQQAVKLYQARIADVVSKEEISATLGDVFGFKVKSDGTPGKTPNGQGEAIRKRIVRASQAWDYVTDGDGGTFFEGLPEDDITAILDAIEGGMSIWTAYDKFAEVKRNHAIKTELAFDVRKMSALVAKLSEPDSGDIIRSSDELIAVYSGLLKILVIIGEAPVAEAA